MNFSFIIVTDGKNDDNLLKVVNSIKLEFDRDSSRPIDVKAYEIIIVGNTSLEEGENCTYVNFDESEKSGWITKKKNIGVRLAKFKNLVVMHDYITLKSGWYESYKNFGEKFDICMNRIENFDGRRFTDWSLCVSFYEYYKQKENIAPHHILLPYKLKNLTKLMYISGAYLVCKRKVLLDIPFNENLCWGQSEDIEWSSRARKIYDFSINENATVKVCKLGKRNPRVSVSNKLLEKLQNLSDQEIQEISAICDQNFFKN